MWKTNIRLRGLKEGVEGGNLIGYLTELFTAWAGSDCEVVITIVSAYRIGTRREVNKYPREVLIKFPKILGIFLDQPRLVVEGSKLQIFPDLSCITVKKRRELKFHTTVLTSLNIRYRWGFPFTLIVYLGGRPVIVSMLQAAKDLCSQLKGDIGVGSCEITEK